MLFSNSLCLFHVQVFWDVTHAV